LGRATTASLVIDAEDDLNPRQMRRQQSRLIRRLRAEPLIRRATPVLL
jgi:hypothetical protein